MRELATYRSSPDLGRSGRALTGGEIENLVAYLSSLRGKSK